MFTAITVLTIAIGIGANTAIFSVINSVLLKPLPYPDPERLVAVWHSAPGLNIPEINASPSTYFTYREENKTFVDTGVWRYDSVSVTGIAEPEQVAALDMTDGVLPTVGVPPMLGRLFTRKDDSPGSPETVILTWGYWQRRFGGDPSIIDRRLIIDGVGREVIGVMPRGFQFLNTKAQMFLPVQLDRAKTFIGEFSYQQVSRLKPGVTLEQANADVARMIPLMATKFPPPPGFTMSMFDDIKMGPKVRPLKNDVVGDVGKVLWVLMGTVAVVLLIACANVANLLLVRAEGRQQELAIRSALGAGWSRLARELMIESLALSALGGLFGLGIAWGALRLLVSLPSVQLPRIEEIAIDPTVLFFTAGISILAGLLFGLVPVFKYAGQRLGTTLRDGGRNASDGRQRHMVRNTLVIAQMAMALVLLICSGLMIRTFQALLHVDPGFRQPEQLQTLRVSMADAVLKEPDQVLQTTQEIAAKLAALPGVQSVGTISAVTMDGNDNNDPIFAEDHPVPENQIPKLRRYKFIGPNIFNTMGSRLIAGRDITWTEILQKRKVVLMSENLARELWNNPAAALGKRVRESPKSPWREVIGVVSDEHDNGANQPAPTIVYWPQAVEDMWGMRMRVNRSPRFVMRTTRAGASSLFNEARQAIWSVNKDLPIADVKTVQEIYEASMARTSFTLVMLGLAASMALLLGVIGIYGVISYSVSQRTREIGIRMALGATRESVSSLFLRHGFQLALIGAAIGLAAAFAATRLMSTLLFGVSAFDPITYGSVPLVLLAAALLATYLPTRRATGIDPSRALRAE
jgi:predicted permease